MMEKLDPVCHEVMKHEHICKYGFNMASLRVFLKYPKYEYPIGHWFSPWYMTHHLEE